MKKILFPAFAILALLIPLYFIFWPLRQKSAGIDFRFFYAGCNIYSREGKIVYKTLGYICDFAEDGKVLISNPSKNKLFLRDHNNRLLWGATAHAHHDIKFTPDQKAFLLITSEVIDFENQKVRGDCFSKRSLDNAILSQWCLSENIPQLKKLGFHFETDPIRAVNRMKRFPPVENEISHANSIYEIENNANSGLIPAFQKGNYLVHLFKSSYALLILDKDMKQILWSKNLSRFKYGVDELQFETHDNQIASDGKVLMYVNVTYLRKQSELSKAEAAIPSKTKEIDWHSSLVKYDPVTEQLEWLYDGTPPASFKSIALGSVTELKNGNYMFSDITNITAVLEVNKDRNVIWKFEYPFYNAAADKIMKAKPMYSDAFLKAHGIQY